MFQSFSILIYLDYNATTPCAPEVLQAMLPYFSQKYGNAASKTHAFGWQADEAVKLAGQQIAGLLNCETEEIIYTSGATESCNLALKGVMERMKGFGNHIITCATEHKAVLDTCEALKKQGADITYLPVNAEGHINLQELEAAINSQTVMIALMYANNETGVIHPVAEIGALARSRRVYFFCDATQAVGKIDVDLQRDNIDLMAFSAHKFYGPKGVGALYVNRKKPRVQLLEQIHGGRHQNGLRSGTLNVPGIVGMGKAAEFVMREEHRRQMQRLQQLRDKLEEALLQLPGATLNGDTKTRLPHVSNIAFQGIKAERLVSRLGADVAFSVGSACTSAQQKASHVLQAMGLDEQRIEGSVRLSLGIFTTDEEISYAIKRISETVLSLPRVA